MPHSSLKARAARNFFARLVVRAVSMPNRAKSSQSQNFDWSAGHAALGFPFWSLPLYPRLACSTKKPQNFCGRRRTPLGRDPSPAQRLPPRAPRNCTCRNRPWAIEPSFGSVKFESAMVELEEGDTARASSTLSTRSPGGRNLDWFPSLKSYQIRGSGLEPSPPLYVPTLSPFSLMYIPATAPR